MPLVAPSGAYGSWRSSTLPGTSANWIGTTYGDSGFVTVAYSSNRAAVSTDGVTWTARTLSSSTTWWGVGWGNGIYATVQNAGTGASISTDGVTWSARTMPASRNWREPRYLNGYWYVAVDGVAVCGRSTDLVTWTQPTMPASTGWFGSAYGNNTYVFGTFSNATAAASSTDGITWSLRTQAYGGLGAMAFGNGVFVAVGNQGSATTSAVATSTDGITWTGGSMPASASWYGVGYGNGYFVATSLSNAAAISTDGITWQQRTSAVSGSHNTPVFGAGRFGCALQNTTSFEVLTLTPDSRPTATAAVARAATW